MTAIPPTIWASRDVVMTASDESIQFDPGTGPGRYGRALDALRSSGSSTAIASFTFDPDEPGSVVVIPDRVVRSTVDHGDAPAPAGARVVEDGTAAWEEAIEGAIDSIGTELVEKIVVVRQVDVLLDEIANPEVLVKRLMSIQPESYVFSIGGLVGASPELLISLENGTAASLVLAGTAVEAEALRTTKMKREHELSRASVIEAIGPHVRSLNVQEPAVRRFGSIQHLASGLEGEALTGVTVMDLVAALHPTAAVAGMPSDTALKIIKDLEPRSRGRFGGPVGWFDTAGRGEFAIALRCGLFEGNRATLYAGGGIVEGSDPATELTETELKLRPMKRALGLLE